MRRRVLLILAVCAGAGPAAAADLPKVSTAFRVQAADFVANLSPATRAELETAMAAELAARVRQHFAFVDWTASTPGAAELRLTMVGEPRGLAARILLEFGATVGGQPLSLAAFPRPLVYEHWDSQPTNDAPALQARLTEVVRALFDLDDFRLRLQKEFLRAVPLTEHVPLEERLMVLTADRRLVLPLSWDALRARSESVLLVRFLALPPSAAEEKDGEILLRPEAPVRSGSLRGLSRCAVDRFTFPPLDPVGSWDDRVAQLLSPAALRGLRVFMDEYVRDVNPVVTRPE
jgi:hypothetical protein